MFDQIEGGVQNAIGGIKDAPAAQVTLFGRLRPNYLTRLLGVGG